MPTTLALCAKCGVERVHHIRLDHLERSCATCGQVADASAEPCRCIPEVARDV